MPDMQLMSSITCHQKQHFHCSGSLQVQKMTARVKTWDFIHCEELVLSRTKHLGVFLDRSPILIGKRNHFIGSSGTDVPLSFVLLKVSGALYEAGVFLFFIH